MHMVKWSFPYRSAAPKPSGTPGSEGCDPQHKVWPAARDSCHCWGVRSGVDTAERLKVQPEEHPFSKPASGPALWAWLMHWAERLFEGIPLRRLGNGPAGTSRNSTEVSSKSCSGATSPRLVLFQVRVDQRPSEVPSYLNYSAIQSNSRSSFLLTGDWKDSFQARYLLPSVQRPL